MKNLILPLLLLSFPIIGCGNDDGQGPQLIQGPKGDPGESSNETIQLIRFTSDSSLCESESGVIVQVLKPTDLFGGTSIDSAAVICDGINGEDGEIGATGPQGPKGDPGATAPTSPYEVTQVIDPCGDAPGIYDEVFLKMANGTLIASFSDSAAGNNTRLSVLVPGSYVTTDGSNCHVVVHSDGTVTW